MGHLNDHFPLIQAPETGLRSWKNMITGFQLISLGLGLGQFHVLGVGCEDQSL